MTAPKRNHNIDRISEIFFDVLKQLSAERRPLTPASLSQAISTHSEVLRMIVEGDPPGIQGADGGIGARQVQAEQQICDLQAQLRSFREKEKKFCEQLGNLEKACSRMREFSRRSILTLLELDINTEDQLTAFQMDRLRSLVRADAPSEEQEACLTAIAEIVATGKARQALREPASQSTEADSRPAAKSPEAHGSSNDHGLDERSFAALREALLGIISQVESAPLEVNLKQLSVLKGRLKDSRDIGGFVPLVRALVDLIRTYMGRAADQNNQIADFAKVLSKNLFEMEKQFLSSVADGDEAIKTDSEFNLVIEGEVTGIQTSFESANNLEEIRMSVLSRLAGIKAAIFSKREEDEARHQQTREIVESLKRNIQQTKADVGRMEERAKTLEREVLLDGLTGIHNRRSYEQRIAEELDRYKRYNQAFSLVLFDVDKFKQLNDKYGHRAGDKCLQEIVNRIKPCIRSSDFLARYGGEEFVIILPGAGRVNAFKVAEKARSIIEKTRFLYQGEEMPVTISLGVAEAQPTDDSSASLFTRVDAAMYHAKNEGRNRVCLAETESEN